MFRQFLSGSMLLALTIAMGIFCLTLTDTPIQQEDAETSIRHECNCRTVEEEVYDGPRDRTTWGAVKSSGTRTVRREKCDVKWHFNPFYHTGACD